MVQQGGISLHAAVLSLQMLLLAGCASPASVTAAGNPPQVNAMQPSVRLIIYFRQPALNSAQLTAAIADSCRCQPVFLRAYGGDALIYEISLPQQQSFGSFEKKLMQQGERLGIKLLEQDVVMQHQ